MRTSDVRVRLPFDVAFQGASFGGFVGAVVGLAVGAVAGAAVGQYNEATLTGDDYEELFLGFAEYSVQGMAFWSALICAVYGGAVGAAAGAVAWVSHRWMAGLAVGIALPLLLWAATDLFSDGRHQAGFVWLLGMLAGAGAAGLLCVGPGKGDRKGDIHLVPGPKR